MIADFYRILSRTVAPEHALYEVVLPTSCAVYRGHFPKEPVAPGVCSLQMIHELAEDMLGRSLDINYIKQCRYTGLLLPDNERVLQVELCITNSDSTTLKATISAEGKTYIKLCAELS